MEPWAQSPHLSDDGAAPYEATPQEKAAIERFRDRRRQKKPTPRFKVEYEGNLLSLQVDLGRESVSALARVSHHG